MNNIIQMVAMNDGESLFILDFDKQKQELTFRTSRMPSYKQKEIITRKGNDIHTSLYFFHHGFLDKFLFENDIV